MHSTGRAVVSGSSHMTSVHTSKTGEDTDNWTACFISASLAIWQKLWTWHHHQRYNFTTKLHVCNITVHVHVHVHVHYIIKTCEIELQFTNYSITEEVDQTLPQGHSDANLHVSTHIFSSLTRTVPFFSPSPSPWSSKLLRHGPYSDDIQWGREVPPATD